MQNYRKILVITLILVVAVAGLVANNWAVWKVSSQAEQLDPNEGDHKYDGVTILKPGEATDFLPTPFTPPTPFANTSPTPGQPLERDFRGSPENLAKITPAPTIKPEEPWVNYVQLDILPPDSKQKALRSELIVLGEVVDVQSYWSTSDGRRPANPHLIESVNYIYSITTIKVEQVLSGEATIGDTLRLIQNGGQVGDDKLIIDDGYKLFTVGQSVLVYLNPIVHPEMQKLVPGVVYSVVERYFVDRTTQVASNPFSQRPLNTLLEEVQQTNQIKQEIREGRFTPPPPGQ